MKNLEYKFKKKVMMETDLKIVILEKYHNFFNIFSNKDFNTLFSYQKYNYKIILEIKQK